MWCTGRFCFSNNCVCIIQTEFQRLADITADLADQIIYLDGPAKIRLLKTAQPSKTWSKFKTEFLHTYSLPVTKKLRMRVDEALQANTLILNLFIHPSS